MFLRWLNFPAKRLFTFQQSWHYKSLMTTTRFLWRTDQIFKTKVVCSQQSISNRRLVKRGIKTLKEKDEEKIPLCNNNAKKCLLWGSQNKKKSEIDAIKQLISFPSYTRDCFDFFFIVSLMENCQFFISCFKFFFVFVAVSDWNFFWLSHQKRKKKLFRFPHHQRNQIRQPFEVTRLGNDKVIKWIIGMNSCELTTRDACAYL